MTLTPQAGSEDFVINFVKKRGKVTPPKNEIPNKKSWKGTLTNKSGTQFTTVGNLFDGDPSTYIDEWDKPGHPIELVIDLGSPQTVGSFSYQKRPGAVLPQDGDNGTMGKYELYVSDDGEDWSPAGSGEFTAEDYNLHEADGLYNIGDTVYGNFNKVYTTQYVKIVQTSYAIGDKEEFTGAEIGLFSDQMVEEGGTGADTDIKASELTVAKVEPDDESNSLRVEFDDYEYGGTTWHIAEVTAMEDDTHYMNSHLEITADDPDAAAIDYIDTDSFVLPDGAKDVWSIPDESKVSSMFIGKHELMLGQPIYVDGLFLGSEFPAEETDVIDDTGTTKMRYYSGKTLSKMAEDGQNVEVDGKSGSVTFRTWSNVVGAAQGTEEDVVQTDFFDYIEDIAEPSEFRKQYNSWFDNMLNITPESVEKSFLGAEKGLAQNGVEPLDSYVVDDGWNNYNSEGSMVDAGMSGTEPNKTGFWEFNSKWPNELYDSTSLAHKLQSSFGMWVGPRGGYNYPGNLANIMQNAGTGFYCSNSGDICTGSRTYIDNYEYRFLDYQERFGINYWKWDGFAMRPCTSEGHNHMTGGPNNMYFTSDMWEAWTDLFEDFRAKSGEDGLWINATCYVNPSPWLLQWVNSVWLQDSADTAQSGNQGASRHQQKIYYRDHVYSNIFKNNDLQFPLKNVYNHDPIYGVSDGSDATTEDFREFLLDNAMRGTAFWELYYSPSIMDEAKWQVNADVLDFAERNHDILKNAKLFASDGAFPTTNLGASVDGVYGYSAWAKDGSAGIVSFVNPTGEQQTYTLKLDDLVGVPQGMENLAKTQIHPYAAAPSGETVSYGSDLSVTLPAHSSQIFQFGEGDTRAPQITSAKITDSGTIRVTYDTRMSDQTAFKVDGKAAEATLMDDYRTFEISSEGLGDSAKLTIDGAKSVFGVDAAKGSAGDMTVDTAGTIAQLITADDAGDAPVYEFATDFSEDPMIDLAGNTATLADEGVSGTSDFSVEVAVKTTGAGTIASQGNDWSLSIDENGYAVFTVAGQSVSSAHDETTVTQKASGTLGTGAYTPTATELHEGLGKVNDGACHTIVASREPNAVLKLYIDGELVNSAYDREAGAAELSGAAVTAGSEGFTGYISGLAVRNSALYYDDAAYFDEGYPEGEPVIYASHQGWTAETCSDANQGSDGNAADAIDGNASTYWHNNYNGTDTCGSNPHKLTVNFGKEITFDSLVYTGRPAPGGNGDWESVKIIGIGKDGKETVLKDTMTGLTLDENRQIVFSFDEPQKCAGVRFEIKGKNGYASAAEIDAATNVEVFDSAPGIKLRAKAVKAEAEYPEADYTPESYETFAKALDAIYGLNPFDAESADKVETLKAELADAIAKLVDAPKPVEVDKTGLQKAVDEGRKLDGSKYTADSWEPYAKALDAAEAVLKDEKATQQQVNDALDELNEAFGNLDEKAEPEPSKPNKGDLQEAVDGYVGQDLDGSKYTAGSWDAYQAALAYAQQVLADEGATQDDIDDALAKLNDAYKALAKKENGSGDEKPDPAPKPGDQKPDDGAEPDGKPGADGGTLVQTGDASLLAAAAAGASGIAATGAGVFLSRRKRK